jgi:hypothetical protein
MSANIQTRWPANMATIQRGQCGVGVSDMSWTSANTWAFNDEPGYLESLQHRISFWTSLQGCDPENLKQMNNPKCLGVCSYREISEVVNCLPAASLIPYILEFNMHLDFAAFLNEKKLVHWLYHFSKIKL